MRDTATGVLNTAAQLGTAIGTAALPCLAESTSGGALPISGAKLGWLAAAALALALAGPAAAARTRAPAGTLRSAARRS